MSPRPRSSTFGKMTGYSKITYLPITPHPSTTTQPNSPSQISSQQSLRENSKDTSPPRKHPKPTKTHIPRHLRKMTRNTKNPKFPLDPHATPRHDNPTKHFPPKLALQNDLQREIETDRERYLQVGVKAPGTASRTTFLPLSSSWTWNFCDVLSSSK